MVVRFVAGFVVVVASVSLAGCPAAPPPETDSAELTEGGKFTTTESGLKYRIRRQGTGVKPVIADVVRVHYRGWLDDGSVFDDTWKKGTPMVFTLNKVIPGWREGLLLARQGGVIELQVPPELGYGDMGFDGDVIPPGSRLNFLIEIIDVMD